jgi:hypothetical protein
MGDDRSACRADWLFKRMLRMRSSARSAKTVRDLQGTVLVDQMVGHVCRLENGSITPFNIREP